MNGPLEADEFRTHTFARSGPLNLTGFSNAGADWLNRFRAGSAAASDSTLDSQRDATAVLHHGYETSGCTVHAAKSMMLCRSTLT
jgi:hypothetical protein